MITDKKRIVAFDENHLFNLILKLHLRNAELFKIINAYSDFNQLMENLSVDKPDFVLMDIPVKEGLAAVEKVKETAPKTSVIILSDNDNSRHIINTLRAGADGYVNKHLAGQDLIRELNKTEKGGVALSPAVARKIVRNFWTASNNPLSKAETKVLRLMTQGRTATSIGNVLNISPSTVRAHIRNIYSKLKVHCRSEAIALALEGQLAN